METEIQLRSKKELIERFISEHLTVLPQGGNLRDTFSKYWDDEKDKAVIRIGEAEGLDTDGLRELIKDFLFTEKAPLPNQIVNICHKRPGLKERMPITDRVVSRVRRVH